jgi:hypothetical protein
VILGNVTVADELTGGCATLDDLFRRAVARRPDAITLCDPPNRSRFTDGGPRRVSYAEADCIVSAMAGRLRRLGLKTDTVIAIQLPNTVEAVLTILGVLRAGMIAAPVPLLWRSADMIDALGRIGCKAIITTTHVGAFDQCGLAMQVAAEIFPVRHVCTFGQTHRDGAVALDDLLAANGLEPAPEIRRDANPADHVAVITFDMTKRGIVPVARSHRELIAGGLVAMLEGRLKPDSVILSCMALSSFAGLALTALPWLLTGGTLSLHHPFDAVAYSVQCNFDRCDTVVVPGPLVPCFVQAGLLSCPQLDNVLAVWRAPERLAASAAWQSPENRLIDVAVFGEAGLVCANRSADGLPQPIPLGTVRAPRGASGALCVLELGRTDCGTLALRGPMVPRHPFPPGGGAGGTPQLDTDPAGFVDTCYPCRLDRDAATLTVTGPPPGIIGVGGYRFLSSELQGVIRRADASATLGALPDAMAGNQLSGNAAAPTALRSALAARGVNPLIAGAFRDRRPSNAP